MFILRFPCFFLEGVNYFKRNKYFGFSLHWPYNITFQRCVWISASVQGCSAVKHENFTLQSGLVKSYMAPPPPQSQSQSPASSSSSSSSPAAALFFLPRFVWCQDGSWMRDGNWGDVTRNSGGGTKVLLRNRLGNLRKFRWNLGFREGRDGFLWRKSFRDFLKTSRKVTSWQVLMLTVATSTFPAWPT